MNQPWPFQLGGHRLFSVLFKGYPHCFFLQEIKDTGIKSVKFYQLLSGSCGFGVLTRNWKFYAVSDLDGMMRVKRMAEVPGKKHLVLINECTQYTITVEDLLV